MLLGVNGTTIYYEDIGSGSPMLMIHGAGDSADDLAGQAQRLAPHVRCISYDCRGHSRSPLGDVTGRSLQLDVDDAAALIHTLAIAPCLLFSISSGGQIALELLRQHPALITAAIFSEPGIFSLDPQGAQALFQTVRPAIDAAVAREGPEGAVMGLLAVIAPGLWETLSAERQRAYRQNSPRLLEDMVRPLPSVTPADLARIAHPCLVIRGDESLPGLRNIAAIMAQSLPNGQLVDLAGAGHLPYFDRPTELAAAITSFATHLPTASPQPTS